MTTSTFNEVKEYRKFTKKSETHKYLNSLKGLLTGITFDSDTNTTELDELLAWCDNVSEFEQYNPFKELIPAISNAVEDNILTSDEIEDIIWICDKYIEDNHYYDLITAGLQELQGIFHGIIADNCITQDELIHLNGWLKLNSFLQGHYPYDEIYTLLSATLDKGTISTEDENILKAFFAEFIDMSVSSNIDFEELQSLRDSYSIHGICIKNPLLSFENKNFCFTGASSKTTRDGFKNIVSSLGGIPKTSVSSKTDYLVIGDEGNPCWAYSCYGRKVEQAITIRKKGGKILIIHENDFWNYIESLSVEE